MPGLLLTGARLVGRAGLWQVSVREGRIESIARDAGDGGRGGGTPHAPAGGSGAIRRDVRTVALGGRLLAPGFHDAHVHVLSAARERAALTLPARIDGWEAVAALLARHGAGLAAGAWLSVRRFDPATMTGGWIPDRAALDRACPDRPVRLRHRNLRLDVLNSAALERVGLASEGDRGARARVASAGVRAASAGPEAARTGGAHAPPDGVERDAAGRPTGRLHQLGPWLRALAETQPSADALRAQVATWSRALLAAGVTSLQDAGEHNGPEQLALLDALARGGAIRQRLWTMASGMRVLEDAWDPRAGVDADAAARIVHAKLAPVEARLDLDALCAAAVAARRAGLPVAVHATSEAELAAAVATIEAAGPAPGGASGAVGGRSGASAPIPHRVEHACVASDALVAAIAASRAAVVANPALVSEAGDAYRAELPPAEHAALHRLASWQAAGVPLAIASDAPVTASPPLAMLDAAMRRRTAGGAALGLGEALSFDDALAAATAAGAALVGCGDLGRVAVGCVADLVALPTGARDGSESVAPWAAGAGGVADHGEPSAAGAGGVAEHGAPPAAGEVDLTVLGGEVVHVGDALRERVGEGACASA